MTLVASLRAAILRVRIFRVSLVSDWKKIAMNAWSVRLWAAASLIILLEPLVELAVELSDNWSLTFRIILKLLSGLLALAGIWARVVKQKEFEDADRKSTRLNSSH